MASESFLIAFKETLKNSLSMTIKVSTHERELAKLITESISDEKKLSNIRLSILNYRATPCEPIDGNFFKEHEALLIDAEKHKLLLASDQQLEASLMQIDMLNMTMDKGLKFINGHNVLLERIKEVLLTSDRTPSDKVTAIQDILL